MTGGDPVARDVLVEEISREATTRTDEKSVLASLRRLKKRETLRICYGDLIERQPLEVVTQQISYLADALIEAALRGAQRKLAESRGVPRRDDGTPARFVVLAMGKLGGVELNYSSDIDLVLLYDGDGSTDGPRRQSNGEFFDALARETVRLLSESTEHGVVYRVDLRLRPEGERGPLVPSLESALHYYDVLGRTWERQAMIKARPVAGDLGLGREFLGQLEPWIYRKYLSRADITGIKALKRRIEQRALREGADDRDVKTGRGGIRDIEFVIQFLQLLNGGDMPELRTGNTLAAIDGLARAGCLTDQERSILSDNYRFLRNIEHRLQIMFDLQTHVMPDDPDELRKLAVRMGFVSTPETTALAAFTASYKSRTELNRKILDQFLHLAFGGEGETEPEVDLVLDPQPRREFIHVVLGKHGFRDCDGAFASLSSLATERIRFLSTRRCRHFLAAIAPRLLGAIAQTPDPDSALVTLANVSDSLGGKGVLWELFSFNPPSLRLYVELCSSSSYLSEILTSNPGMIDELLDSLLLDKLPTPEWLEATLSELCRGAEDIEPILHSFKNAQQLRVGIRDILGKDDIRATNAALADIAQACVARIAIRERDALVEKFGQPTIDEGDRAGKPSELVILGMGKFGGREPNYHSDLDVIFLYDADGTTQPDRRGRKMQETTNQHFYGELGQRIIKTTTRLGPYGRLYEMDPRLRPTGRSGALATALDEFERYFAEGSGQLWERMALCKARAVFGSTAAIKRAMRVVRAACYDVPWRSENADEVYAMRMRMQETANPRNLKRGAGGIVDVEFLVQMLQLAHEGRPETIRTPGTLDALAALHEADYLSADDHEFLSRAYRFLRNVEARIRLMNMPARHELPEDERDLARLARLLGYTGTDKLLYDCQAYTTEVRRRFDRIVAHGSAVVR
jgi:glutamate-ammonia-ligase adenylyltransferase